jgi:hypothetical protein
MNKNNTGKETPTAPRALMNTQTTAAATAAHLQEKC